MFVQFTESSAYTNLFNVASSTSLWRRHTKKKKKNFLVLFLHEQYREAFFSQDNVLSSALTTPHMNECKREEKRFFANVIPTTTDRKEMMIYYNQGRASDL